MKMNLGFFFMINFCELYNRELKIHPPGGWWGGGVWWWGKKVIMVWSSSLKLQ